MEITLTLNSSASSYDQPVFKIDGQLADYSYGFKAVRKKYNMNTKALGEICGVSPRSVEGWEQGRRSPSKPAMMLLKSWLKDKEMFGDD